VFAIVTKPLPVAVWISGGGTTLRNLIAKRDAGELPIEIRSVTSSAEGAGGLQIAQRAGIPTRVITRRSHASLQAYSQAMFDPCRDEQVQLVVMAGFLKLVPIPGDFDHRVTNIHPGLIPAFCGHGMYGNHVHQAVIDYGAKISGCTVHFVDNQYDHGPIILQRVCDVLDDDTAQSLAARVFQVECDAYPTALRWIAEGRLSVAGRQVRCQPMIGH
jgi:phosphoribosylglycinamide formyltransferase 1